MIILIRKKRLYKFIVVVLSIILLIMVFSIFKSRSAVEKTYEEMFISYNIYK
ncbi:hypothetical protein ACER0A_006070 [Haloimpatiens sp. FM7315]|uniref:hypothetical protein n=1 Tax=Haloimpatiens sp. FM7315 TaxID=3298609 RepID=UPI0035A37CED